MCSEIKGDDQLRGYFAFVGYMQNVVFFHDAAHMHLH